MNELIKAKLFYKFLRKNCVLKEYVYNVLSYNTRIGIEVELPKKFNGQLNVIEFLTKFSHFGNAFIWHNTKQGDAFWRGMEASWAAFHIANS